MGGTVTGGEAMQEPSRPAELSRRLSMGGAVILLLGTVAFLRGSAGLTLTLAQVGLAALVVISLVLHRAHPVFAAGALLWMLIQLARAVGADPRLVVWLSAATFALPALLALRTSVLPKAQRPALLADLVTITAALIGIEWFALQQWAGRSTSWTHVLLVVLLAVPASSALTHVIHASTHRPARLSIALGTLLLLTFVVALSVTESLAIWDVVAGLGFLLLLTGIGRIPHASMSISPASWPSPMRLIPVLLVTLSLGMAVGHGALNRWQPSDLAVAALLAGALIVRQFLSFIEERRMAVFIASQGRELRHQALHDPLTDLANRDLFYDRLEHALTVRQRASAPIAVIHIDINAFKDVNERHGYGTGDALLVALADRISTWVRPADTVARLGGDEFAIIVDGSADAALVVAQRLSEEIARGFELSGRLIHVEVSMGVATLNEVGEDIVEATGRLINQADRAMHQSRRAHDGSIVAVQA